MLWIIGCSVFVVVAMQKRKIKAKEDEERKSKPCVMSILLSMHLIAKRELWEKEREKRKIW